MQPEPPPEPYAIGIECGGTRTTVITLKENGRPSPQAELPAANLRLIDDAYLRGMFETIARRHPHPTAVGIGMAGIRTDEDRHRVRRQLWSVWPAAKIYPTDDLESALEGLPEESDESEAHILIIAGTGASCLGRDIRGREARVSGWGHILGDECGGYGIGLAGLKILVREADQIGKPSRLLQKILNNRDLKSPDQLIQWIQTASKTDIGDVAIDIFSAWRRGHAACTALIEHTIRHQIEDAQACVRRLESPSRVRFILNGGCFSRQKAYRAAIAERLEKLSKHYTVASGLPNGALGAARLAWRKGASKRTRSKPESEQDASRRIPIRTSLSPTEERHPKSMSLDRLSIQEGIELMAAEDARLPPAILTQTAPIEKTIRWVTRSLKSGGRLFYFGAGTSGRLGVLDASECPPTFRTEPELVQGIIAGGDTALRRSVEGAEDSLAAGISEIEDRNVTDRDTVVGIAASGRTPFVWGALTAARDASAKTVLLTFNPHLRFGRGYKPHAVICPDTGPEILAGSTRLKSGTATKMILNMITTLAMVRLGKVIENLMVDLNPNNEKLRERAVRILSTLTREPPETTLKALEANDWQVKRAYRQLQVRRTR